MVNGISHPASYGLECWCRGLGIGQHRYAREILRIVYHRTAHIVVCMSDHPLLEILPHVVLITTIVYCSDVMCHLFPLGIPCSRLFIFLVAFDEHPPIVCYWRNFIG